MSFIEPKDLKKLKEIDLLTYLSNYEPERLKKISRNTFCIRDHDSLHISNGLWHWQSCGIGGRSALDFLIKVDHMSFKEAVDVLRGKLKIKHPKTFKQEWKEESKSFLLPYPAATNEQGIRYLRSRGISDEVILECINDGLFYESVHRDSYTKKLYRNATFIGFNKEARIPQYASLRGINSDFKGESSGSDKRYSFALEAAHPSSVLHVCEAPIDVLSYASLMKLKHQDHHDVHILSLGGVQIPRKDSVISCKTPIALEQYLNDHAEINHIVLHLDNDRAGRLATRTIQQNLTNYHVSDSPPKYGKDANDELKTRLGIEVFPQRQSYGLNIDR